MNDTFSSIGLLMTILGMIIPGLNQFIHRIQSIEKHFKIKNKKEDASLND